MCQQVHFQDAYSHVFYVQTTPCSQPIGQTCRQITVIPEAGTGYNYIPPPTVFALPQPHFITMAYQPPYQGPPYAHYPGPFDPVFYINGAPHVQVGIPPGGGPIQVPPPPFHPPGPPQPYLGQPQFVLYPQPPVHPGAAPATVQQPPPPPPLLGPFGPGPVMLPGGRGYIPNDPPFYYHPQPGVRFYPQQVYASLPQPQPQPLQPQQQQQPKPPEIDLLAIPPNAHQEYVYQFIQGAWRPFIHVRAPDLDPTAPGMMRQQGWNPQSGFDEGPMPPGWEVYFPDLPIVSPASVSLGCESKDGDGDRDEVEGEGEEEGENESSSENEHRNEMGVDISSQDLEASHLPSDPLSALIQEHDQNGNSQAAESATSCKSAVDVVLPLSPSLPHQPCQELQSTTEPQIRTSLPTCKVCFVLLADNELDLFELEGGGSEFESGVLITRSQRKVRFVDPAGSGEREIEVGVEVEAEVEVEVELKKEVK